MVRVQSLKAPMPPVEMSACSAAKSGHCLHPSRVQACPSFSDTSWYPPSWVQIWKTPLMLIFLMAARVRPYLASKRSSKMASSKVFEQRRPMESDSRRATFPAFDRFGVGQGVGRVGVARPGGGQDFLTGSGHGRDGLPGRPVAFQSRDE